MLFENYSHSSCRLSSKNNDTYSKKKKKSSASYSWDFAINQSKNDKRSHGYNINKPRSRHGHKFSKYKTSLSMMWLY